MMNYLFVIIFTFSCFLLNAQNLYFCFGANTSRTTFKYLDQQEIQRKSCPDFNFLVETNNQRRVSFKSGVILCRSFDLKYMDVSTDPDYKVSTKVNYIEIPLVVSVNFHKDKDLLYFISSGLSISHGIGGETNTTYLDVVHEEGFPKQIRSNNFGVLISTGFNYRRVQISLYYRYFNDIQRSSTSYSIQNLDNSVLGINLSFIVQLMR